MWEYNAWYKLGKIAVMERMSIALFMEFIVVGNMITPINNITKNEYTWRVI